MLREKIGKCVCDLPKGYICAAPEFKGTAHSNWTEHGMCEMHDFKVANAEFSERQSRPLE